MDHMAAKSRHAKHREYMLRDKELLRKHRELDHLRDLASECYYEPINPPYRDGYIRRPVLRSDVAKSSEAIQLNKVLDIVGEKEFSRTKHFCDGIKKDGKRISLYCVYTRVKKRELKTMHIVDSPLKINSISERRYEMLEEGLKKYFYPSIVIPRYNWCQPYLIYKANIPSWKIVPKIESHFIYSRRVYDSNAESRYSRLSDEINSANLWPKINHILGYSRIWDYGWDDEKRLLSEKVEKEIMRQEVLDYFLDK